MWHPQLDSLETKFNVLRFDTRGHGDSDAPEGKYTLELLAADAVALMDALEIDAVHFVGLSMGGMIGQNLALDHGDRRKVLPCAIRPPSCPMRSNPYGTAHCRRPGKRPAGSGPDETLDSLSLHRNIFHTIPLRWR